MGREGRHFSIRRDPAMDLGRVEAAAEGLRRIKMKLLLIALGAVSLSAHAAAEPKGLVGNYLATLEEKQAFAGERLTPEERQILQLYQSRKTDEAERQATIVIERHQADFLAAKPDCRGIYFITYGWADNTLNVYIACANAWAGSWIIDVETWNMRRNK